MVDEEAPARPEIGQVRKQYEDERYFQDSWAAAQYAYALAVRLREVGEVDEARRYAKECLWLAETLPANTLDDVTTEQQSVGGVSLPERFHDGVVRSRLADLLTAA
ncbi:hypothetical protein [Mangrovihabitans endophyticus]|uniref:Uncharacterized protein n=1 Tax=Mangrovihabitans endophyticus TaxID=1751298 RepID=A0A8J3C3R1_9ACTN|nr:hypothetical protein [Mangrovihabitans endophyticus]GGL05192.1 hypothetical protein GCM10012284_44620 [Mangrovihabitans endophyticus]